MTDAIVIGAGPAGLMAAEALVDGGHSVTLIEAKPSFGRKLLMAGKSGLNLTKEEGFEAFVENYGDAADWLKPMLQTFGPDEVVAWANTLGQETFTGSSKRIFPKSMKASPLLRAWLARLNEKGVKSHTRWRWTGWEGDLLSFATPDGPKTIAAKATVLALGGASWSRLGSDGAWAPLLADRSVELAPFEPSNMGFVVDWSDHMARHFGKPVKTCSLTAGRQVVRGEFVVSSKGIEGGAVYALSKILRLGGKLKLDLLPDRTLDFVMQQISRPQGKNSLSNHLRKVLKLDPVRLALLQEFAHPLSQDPVTLAHTIKSLRVNLNGPRPLDEAISTAGGVARTAVNDGLMTNNIPGVFVCGEMLDWEAPTGGYLLTACLSTGHHAGNSAVEYLNSLS